MEDFLALGKDKREGGRGGGEEREQREAETE